MQITPVLWTYRETKDKLYPIKLRIAADNKPAKYVNLGVKVTEVQWVKDRVHKSHPDAERINQLIRTTILKIEEQILTDKIEGGKTKVEEVQKLAESKNDFYYFFQQFIGEARKRDSHHRADVDQSILNILKLWRPVWPLDEVNVKSIQSLREFLKGRGNSKNTVSHKMMRIQAVLNKNRSLFKANPFEEYKITFEETQPKTVSDHDLEMMRSITIPENWTGMDLARDMWLFSFNTGGVRFGDLCRLTNSCLVHNRLIYRMNKNKKPMNIPLSEEALAIAEKYKTSNPDAYLFPVLNSRQKNKQAIRFNE